MLIDGDNAQPSLAHLMFDRAASFGLVTVRRIYGDWTTPNLNGWKKILAPCAIQPIQQFANTTGKNSTDSALIIDAMDILHSGAVDGFCLVSSDGDYTRLAVRMREAGLFVMGIGNQTTPQAFVAACEVFVFTNDLLSPQTHGPAPAVAETPKQRASTHQRPSARSGKLRLKLPPAAAIPIVHKAVDMSPKRDGWAHLSMVATTIRVIEPSFDVRRYGLEKLSSLVERLSTEFTMQAMPMPAGNQELYVRRRSGSVQ